MTENPVWKVYDHLRTSRLNVKYYSAFRLKYAKLKLWTEILLNLFASASLVAGASISDLAWGYTLWITCSFLTVLFATLGPFLRFGDKERAAESVLQKYLLLTRELEFLAVTIRSREKYGPEEQKAFHEIVDRYQTIAEESITFPHDKSLIKELQAQINKEMPPDSFYVPGREEGF